LKRKIVEVIPPLGAEKTWERSLRQQSPQGLFSKLTPYKKSEKEEGEADFEKEARKDQALLRQKRRKGPLSEEIISEWTPPL